MQRPLSFFGTSSEGDCELGVEWGAGGHTGEVEEGLSMTLPDAMSDVHISSETSVRYGHVEVWFPGPKSMHACLPHWGGAHSRSEEFGDAELHVEAEEGDRRSGIEFDVAKVVFFVLVT